MSTVTFDKSAKKFILDSFNKSIDDNDFIVERDNPSKKVISLDGQEIKSTELGGIKKGSEIYLKSDFISIIKFLDTLIT